MFALILVPLVELEVRVQPTPSDAVTSEFSKKEGNIYCVRTGVEVHNTPLHPSPCIPKRPHFKLTGLIQKSLVRAHERAASLDVPVRLVEAHLVVAHEVHEDECHGAANAGYAMNEDAAVQTLYPCHELGGAAVVL